MANSSVTVMVSFASKEILNLISDRLGIEIIDKAEFSRRINLAVLDFVIPRLFIEQMKIDGIVKIKDE